jgi:predicted acetyltransferase
LEQPIRAYLTAKSDKPVGDIFLNAVTRKGNRKRLLRLFSRNQVFYNAKGNVRRNPAANSWNCIFSNSTIFINITVH